MSNTTKPENGHDDPLIVFVSRTHCPGCGGTNLQTQRSSQRGPVSFSDRGVQMNDPGITPGGRRRYLHIRRPRCPACGSHKLRSYRSTANGDGSVTRHSKCLDCGVKLLIVVE